MQCSMDTLPCRRGSMNLILIVLSSTFTPRLRSGLLVACQLPAQVPNIVCFDLVCIQSIRCTACAMQIVAKLVQTRLAGLRADNSLGCTTSEKRIRRRQPWILISIKWLGRSNSCFIRRFRKVPVSG